LDYGIRIYYSCYIWFYYWGDVILITKEYADRVLNNVKHILLDARYFKCTETMCRNIQKVRSGIKNGFDKEN